jgi:hypothetical protein
VLLFSQGSRREFHVNNKCDQELRGALASHDEKWLKQIKRVPGKSRRGSKEAQRPKRGTFWSLPDCLLVVKITHSKISQARRGPRLVLYFGSDASFSSLIWRLSIRRSILRHIFKCTLLTLFFPLHCDIPVVDSSRGNFHGLLTSAPLCNLNSSATGWEDIP